jgi:predicted aspartyl protease
MRIRLRSAALPGLRLLLLLAGSPLLAQTPLEITNTMAVLPLENRRNHIYVRPGVKGAERPVTMMLDTGFTLTTLKPDLVETLPVRRSGRTIIMGIAGKEEAPVYDGLVFTFGNLSYAPHRVAALPSDRGSRRVDGTLGLSFFQRFVVEMDQNTLRLHEPASYHYTGSGEVLPFKLEKRIPVIDATLPLPGREPVQGRFEIDTGCTSCLCLGSEFVRSHELLKAAGATAASDRDGIGGGVSTHEGHLPQLRLGTLGIEKPSTSFFREGSPAEPGLAGHIGWDALRRFKVIFDYSRQQLILEQVPAKP